VLNIGERARVESFFLEWEKGGRGSLEDHEIAMVVLRHSEVLWTLG